MKLVEYDYEQLRYEKIGSKSDILGLIDEFVNSGMKCAKIENFTHKNAQSLGSSIRRATRECNRFSIKVVVRKDEVFVINTSID